MYVRFYALESCLTGRYSMHISNINNDVCIIHIELLC
jgi:hypothetical protein